MANNEEITLHVSENSPYVIGARAYVEQTENGAVITIIDKEGTTTATVSNGKGIASATLNEDYTLTLIYTDGTSVTTTSIRGEKGESGVYCGSEEPDNPDVDVWIDPTGDPYPMEDEIADAVDEWITAHPEYVTTVQDGAITVPKFAAGVVDAGLNKAGYPADSKATGDAFTADRTRLTAVEGEADALDARITNLAQLTDGSTTGDAELMDARVVGSTTYSTLHEAIDTEFTNVKSALKITGDALLDSDKTNMVFFNASGLELGKKLDMTTGEVITASSNNFWTYVDFLPIPQGATIYFPRMYPFKANAYFYDAAHNFLGRADTSQEAGSLYWKTYQNSNARYVRFVCYNANGYNSSYDAYTFCYAYISVNDKSATKKYNFVNGAIESDGTLTDAARSVITRDICYTDVPLIISATNSTNAIVVFYDQNGTFLLYSSTGSATHISIPSKTYFRVCFSFANQTTAKDLESIEIVQAENNIGILTVDANMWYPKTSKTTVGNIDINHAENDILVHCDDWSDYTAGIQVFDASGSSYAGYWSVTTDIIINKGIYYRFVAKKSDGSLADYAIFDHIKFIPLGGELRTFADLQLTGTNNILAQLKRRLALLESNSLPSYYNDYIASKEADIEDLYSELTSGTQFVWLTDYHYNGYNQTAKSKLLIDHLIRNTHLNKVFNGGDIISTRPRAEDTDYAVCCELIRKALTEMMPDESANYYQVLGNHDTGLQYYKDGGTTVTYGPYLTTEELADLMPTGYNQSQLTIDPNGYGFHYYFDDDVNKIRYLVTNVNLRDYGGTEGFAATYEFDCNAMLSMPDDYTMIIFAHKVYNDSGTSLMEATQYLLDTADAYNSRDSVTYFERTYNFEACGGKIACLIGGHCHKDLSTSSTDGIPVICTTTDNAGGELGGLTRTVGTVSEQAFDVFTIDTTNETISVTRIGAGSDRTFSY